MGTTKNQKWRLTSSNQPKTFYSFMVLRYTDLDQDLEYTVYKKLQIW